MHYLSGCNDKRFHDVPGAGTLGGSRWTTHLEGMIVIATVGKTNHGLSLSLTSTSCAVAGATITIMVSLRAGL
ncbi:hypothetical protein BKA82DRAFT_394465 [Pisolithus tinctorius]|uniref:Uncharacterized protein n=1 Tax=Pisolithus tinctorius Marx 270 TaxID=870435 RepID=A0A0C3P3X6_PISTI|nr:hypothetical protein BKA82DRAFT_394465 [Pisolithus tinctorius]KIO07750.1 hypothetical protein M404DRAFT_394465 [Pisolithus tinctorius Marx 270]